MMTHVLGTESETVREVYAALNRNDVPAMVAALDPDIEWTDPVEDPPSGTYRGLEEVEAHISEARATWAEGSCELERLIVAGNKIVAFVNVRVRLKDHVDWATGQLADVYTFRNGKVIGVRSFPDRQKGLEWAGAKA